MSTPKMFDDWVVLIVDDEYDNVDVAAQILSFYGAQVHTARHGAEGLANLETMPSPTLILMDLSMPTMDGWEALQALRADARWTTTPVIALTAHAMAGDRERALEAGFDDYITKPFRITEFLSDIQKVVKRLDNRLTIPG